MDFVTPGRIGLAVTVICIVSIVRFVHKLRFQRSIMKNMPGAPHSFLWGHLICMNEVLKTQPKRAAPQTIWLPFKEKYGLGDAFYVDVWPFSDPLLMIFDADMMSDVTVKQSLPKHTVVGTFMNHLAGPDNMVSAEGAQWKKWRSAFNPGFSASHLISLVPQIIDDCTVFCDILTKRAKSKEPFRMEVATTKLTVDIIGRVVLDLSFNAQEGPNELVDTLINQLQWVPLGAQINPYELIDIRRPFILRYNTYVMNRYIGRCLDERFATRAIRGKKKHVIDLALDTYLKEVKGETGDDTNVKHLDAQFKKAAISNVITFLFAGHDTTSSTICYAYYYLSKAPTYLEKARRELDEVFGPDQSTVAEKLKQDPHIINKLDYIMAIIRESLRMQPPASTLRLGQKGVFVRDPKTGEAFSTEHCMVWPLDVGISRATKYWSDPHEFRPERFLSPEGYNKDAWIAFSKGNRNCIGQELAIIEMKIILAMTLRMFDFKAAFDELDKLKGDGSGYPSDSSGIQTQYDDPAYQIQVGAAKPREGMPCRIYLR